MSVDHCSLDEYLLDPCRASSLPYWKAKSISIPDHMKIVHHENFDPNAWTDFCDDTYFRLRHDLQDMTAPCQIDGFLSVILASQTMQRILIPAIVIWAFLRVNCRNTLPDRFIILYFGWRSKISIPAKS